MSTTSRHARTLTLTEVSPRNTAVGHSPLRFGVHSIQNQRKEMEDAHCAVLGREGRPHSRGSGEEGDAALGSFSFFAIFDGHGGARAAEFAREQLLSLLAAESAALAADPAAALSRAFEQTEERWVQLAREESLMDGTTAAVVLVDRSTGRCIVGNVGDSEALIGSRTLDGATEYQVLTEVHHPKRNPGEAERITSLGGHLWHGRLSHPKISPQVISLSVSRAIGDLFFKDDSYTGGQPSGLTAEPFIDSFEVCGANMAKQFLLIGCDGLWDTVTPGRAAEFVFARLGEQEDPQKISESLVNLARESGSSDNITVIVVEL